MEKDTKNRITCVTTKRGDAGVTNLGCGLVSKNHPAIILLSELDMLNVMLGDIKQQGLQNIIFDISAAVYNDSDLSKVKNHLRELEWHIEDSNKDLKPLKEFIKPSGKVHLARTQARRCEILAWAYDESKEYCKYLNRLSDYLFVLARTFDKSETLWEHNV